MAIKLSSIARFGIVLVALAWASALSDNLAHAQYQTVNTPQQSIGAVSAGIAGMQLQVAAIQRQVASVAVSAAPSPMTLDQIQAQVNIIEAKKDQIAAQVAQIVNARRVAQPQANQVDFTRVSQALALIQQSAQVIAQEMQGAGVVVPVAGVNSSVERQILVIQQKIVQLKQQEQLLLGTTARVQSPSTPASATQGATVQTPASGLTCDAASGTCQAASTPSTASQPVQTAAQPKSWWQSVWDFIRNLFTF